MTRLLSVSFAALLVFGAARPAPADEKEATAVLDKAIKALGIDEKAGNTAYSWKVKGVVSSNGNDSEINGTGLVQGVDHHRAEINIEANGNQFKVITVLNGDKGWRKLGDNQMPLDDDALAEEKRNVFRAAGVATIIPFKAKGVKVDTAGEEKIGDKAAVILKITGVDGKDFKVSFDKESGLPVKSVAQVKGFQGEDMEQESHFKNYQDFKGRKFATKVEIKRNGEKFIDEDLSDYKTIDKVEAGAFDEPQ